MRERQSSNYYAERALDDLNKRLAEMLDAEVLALVGGLMDGVDDAIKDCVEDVKTNELRPKLCMIVTTTGGYIEVVERIVGTLRHHFASVEFIVPNHAYSAGTALVLSGDAIYMNYYSRLGPIDPQVRSDRGRPVPATGYLDRYKAILDDVRSGNATTADVALLLEFDQAELYSFDQARKLAIRLVTEWLAKYKFKNWTWSESQQCEVTTELRMERATKIASKLSDTNRWNSHSYGISKDVLTDLGIKIDDLDADRSLKDSVEDYNHLLQDYLHKIGSVGAVHMDGHLVCQFP